MANLPDRDKLKLKKVIYVYEDGSEYTMNDPEPFNRNLDASSVIYVTHGGEFEKVEWEQTKKGWE